MFCFQCQETAKNQGCTVKGGLWKTEETANLQDLLIYALKGIPFTGEKAAELAHWTGNGGKFIAEGLFSTITNVNWYDERFNALIRDSLKMRDAARDRFMAAYREKNGSDFTGDLHDAAVWFANDAAAFREKAKSVGILSTQNEDVRSPSGTPHHRAERRGCVCRSCGHPGI